MRTHHLHVTLRGSNYWNRLLAFRDRLRADPEAAERYVELKLELVRRHSDDSRAYTAGKTALVTTLQSWPGRPGIPN
jgi:GrpB-like predicted nucleotidyltransferase (UPF0157 family)